MAKHCLIMKIWIRFSTWATAPSPSLTQQVQLGTDLGFSLERLLNNYEVSLEKPDIGSQVLVSYCHDVFLGSFWKPRPEYWLPREYYE